MYYKIKKKIIFICIFSIIFVLFNFYLKTMENKIDKISETLSIFMQDDITQFDTQDIDIKEQESEEQIIEINEDEADILGTIMIPKINLIAQIKEGTTNNIINYYVGHFEETSLNQGNIGLAAHNRGKNIKSYFANIKNLQENDIIIYKTKEIERTYLVKTVKIIEDTDFSYLEQTSDNRITLITCVNNEPNYRLCVQGVEKI